MSEMVVEAAWANLVRDLEETLDEWGVKAPEFRARHLARDMRKRGWRVPEPEHCEARVTSERRLRSVGR